MDWGIVEPGKGWQVEAGFASWTHRIATRREKIPAPDAEPARAPATDDVDPQVVTALGNDRRRTLVSTSAAEPTPIDPRPEGRSDLARLLRLAAPAVLSYLLSSAYRVNDQFWIQGLGSEAQSAMAAATFVAIANFALPFLAAAGALSLVSRAIGSGDEAFARTASRHAMGLALVLGLAVALLARPLAGPIADLLELEGATRTAFVDYIAALFTTAPVLFVVPVLDHVFIGRGRTIAPMVLQVVAVTANTLLNPFAIYGSHTEAAMQLGSLGERIDAVALALGMDGGLGMAGAAWATGASRLLALAVGLAWLTRSTGTSLRPTLSVDGALLRRIVRISTPVSLSIALYAFVYWALFAFVLSQLDDEVKAGLGIGFLVFEGIAYPTFLGLSMAASSLCGRAIGAGDRASLDRIVGVASRTSFVAGLVAAAAFIAFAEPVAAVFTDVPRVREEVVLYARVLALSQVFVAFETQWDKILMASGRTRAIAWVGGLGNALRIPLALLFVGPLGWGAAGVWWAINVTTVGKSLALWLVAREGSWKRGEGA